MTALLTELHLITILFAFDPRGVKSDVFEIGDEIEIILQGGEAYEVWVKSHGTKIPLADKGMGSIQAMLLILRLACLIDRNEILGSKFVIVIEEPELNLHPALQSKLCELFYEVNTKYGFEFIIETHSEYLIRKSQVIVASNELEVSPNINPFIVYYFPKDSSPYQLKYEQNGRFNSNFGPGFFDEATSSTMAILKMQKEK